MSAKALQESSFSYTVSDGRVNWEGTEFPDQDLIENLTLLEKRSEIEPFCLIFGTLKKEGSQKGSLC